MSIHEENQGQKSRATVPLSRNLSQIARIGFGANSFLYQMEREGYAMYRLHTVILRRMSKRSERAEGDA